MRVSGGASGGGGMVIAVCVAIGLLAAGGVAGANEPPVADAGLDQSVERNATVYLDAGGSYDPDGEVGAYEWSVVAPNGTTFEPACATCERTRFRATQTGQYNVTVTVTDGTGGQTRDTIYITVDEPDPPDLQLSGPGSLSVGTNGTVRADVTAGDDPLSRLVWSVDGGDAGSEPLTGPETSARSLSFTEAGSHTVTAAVTDVLGRTTTDTHALEVTEATAPSGSGGSGASGGGGIGSGSFDARTDFVAANADTIRSYSDLSFNNYADGDSAITLANTAGPGTITLVDEETAQKYLEPYNWHSVNLGDLVEDDLVSADMARKILNRAQQNQEEKNKGAVGGINPYEPTNTREETTPVNSQTTVIGPSPSAPASATGLAEASDATGSRSSETITLTRGSTNIKPSSHTTNPEPSAPALSKEVTLTSGAGSTGVDTDIPTDRDDPSADPTSTRDASSSDRNTNDSTDSERSSGNSTADGKDRNRGNGSGTVTFS